MTIPLTVLCVVALLSTLGPHVESFSRPPESSDTACSYAECIFEGISPRRSEIDHYLVLLNIRTIPDDIVTRCPNMLRRIDKCEYKKSECPRRLLQPWSHRLLDDFYVEFLMYVGSFSCRFPEEALKLKACLSPDLETALQTCNKDPHDFDFQCMNDTYAAESGCPPDIDNYFLLLLQRLKYNPYSGAIVLPDA